MSTAGSLAAFVAVAAILVLTPGIGTAFLTSTVIAHGRKAGYLTAMGMVLGAAVHATIAIAGTAFLLRQFPRALTWIALVGGSFIIVLGIRALVGALRPAADDSGGVAAPPPSGHTFVVTGVLVALSNAPLPLFYFVVVPRYAPPTMSPASGAALLSVMHLSMAGTWMITFVTLVGQLVGFLRRPRILFGLRCATGLLLVALGLQAVLGAM